MKTISFVIPCYRSALTLPAVVQEIKERVAERTDYSYEVILVSDHSPDNVYEVIKDLCAKDPEHLRGFELSRNFGQHAALMAGYAQVKGDYVFSLDDDGQAPVDAVYVLIDKLEAEHLDVVIGSYAEKRHNAFRNVGTKINELMAAWIIGKPKGLHDTSFFVVRRYINDEILRYHEAFPYVFGLLLRSTKRIANCPVVHRERASGTSGYSFAKLLGLWLNGFTAFSVKPLRMASFLGFVCAAIGVCAEIYVVVNKFLDPDKPMGYSSIMAIIIFIGGALMLMLGMIGEYVGRIYMCINKTPQYVIADRTDKEVS